MQTFYTKLLIRQFRLTSIRLFCIAVAAACAVTFSITLLGDRLENLFNMQAKEVLAADIVLQSSSELNATQTNIINSFALEQAKTLTFQTMANAVENNMFLLSSVKAVTDTYPLLGELQIAETLYGEAYATTKIPSPGEAWVEDRVLNELGLEINQSIYVGEKALNITRVLVFEPDRGNSFYSFTPRILINWQDVDATQVVQPGSRVKYRYLFTGEESQLVNLQEQLASSLQLNQQFISVDAANQSLSNTLDRAYRFLNITALIAILLGAVAAGLVSFHYANEMTYQYALLRCLGLKSLQMALAIVVPFICFTVIAIIVGLLIGGLAHLFILNTLSELLPESLPYPSIQPFLLTTLTALIVVISFAWPFIRKLLNTAPKLLLNRLEAQQHPFLMTFSFILVGLSTLVYLGTRDMLISIYIILALLGFVIISYFLTGIAISYLTQLTRYQQTSFRLAVRNLKANHRMVVVQVIAISLTFFSLALISTVRDDIVASWQSKVPDNAPNIFAINLFDDDKPLFLQQLANNNIEHTPLYPIVRGRLSAVNEIPIDEYANYESGRYDESLERDLALTWDTRLPAENEILQGNWHGDEKITNSVSIEEGIAENLAIEVGDVLSFDIETNQVSATVTSIRSVVWESFTPNFYMIFTPDVLDDLPTTYMSSMHLYKSDRTLLREFVRMFPSATFFDVDFLLNRIRQIANNVSYAVETVLYFSLLSSILVFLSIEVILRRYRIYSTAILKAVGANSQLVQNIYRIEFIVVGLISGIIAYILNLVFSYAITNYVIEGEFIFNIKTAILCLFIAPLLVYLIGFLSVKRNKEVPVKSLLSDI